MLFPKQMVHRVTDISPEDLKAKGIKGLILDIDNTLTTHDNPIPSDGVSAWLDSVRASGILMLVLSNNHEPRVEPFAKILGLDFIAEGKKPLTGGFKRCAKALGMNRDELCIIGDQIFTDVLGGNLIGCHSILVEPIQPESTAFFKFKRFLEKIILFFYRKRA